MQIATGTIRWRVTRELKGKGIAQLVGYVDGRTVMNLLDGLDPDWTIRHEPIVGDGQIIAVQAVLTVNGVVRSDVGVPSKQDSIKGAYSDSMKRAAVHFGIGRELYELPQVYAGYDPETKTPTQKPRFNMDNGRWEIDTPGWVWYADEEPEPTGDRLPGLLDAVQVLLKARPDLKGAVKGYVEKNQLKKTDADDMGRLVDWLSIEVKREVQ